jgi:hypothetical protein
MTAQVSPNGTLLQTWASSGDVTTPAQPTIDQGWSLGQKPPNGTMNWIHNEQQQKINHILQHGVSFWDNATGYVVGDLVNLNGVVYKALTANTAITPVAGGNPTWAVYQKSLSAGSSAITISESVNDNTSTIDVSGSGLVSKFEDSEQITWSDSSGKAKAFFKYKDILQLINVNHTLTAGDIGRNIYWATDSGGTSDYTLSLPSAASLPNNWFVDISVLNNKNTVGGILKLEPNGSDQLIRNNVQSNDSVNFIVGTKNTFIRVSKLPNINVFSVSGLNEASYEEEITDPLTGGNLISRGYSLTGDTLHQWYHFTSDVNPFPAGGRANIVEVPLIFPYVNNRYCSTVSVDDDSIQTQSATYVNQPLAYAYSNSQQLVRIGSYYNASEIRLWLMTTGISTGFRG